MIDSIAFYYINWPIARGIKSVLDSCFDGNWENDIAPMDKDDFGGLKSNTISLYLTDIAHHHLGVGILFVLSSHLYKAVASQISLCVNEHNV